MINVKGHAEYDLDASFGISDIKNVVFFEDFFYIICNKKDAKLGYYVLKIPEANPLRDAGDEAKKADMFLINYRNKLEIGDVNA